MLFTPFPPVDRMQLSDGPLGSLQKHLSLACRAHLRNSNLEVGFSRDFFLWHFTDCGKVWSLVQVINLLAVWPNPRLISTCIPLIDCQTNCHATMYCLHCLLHCVKPFSNTNLLDPACGRTGQASFANCSRTIKPKYQTLSVFFFLFFFPPRHIFKQFHSQQYSRKPKSSVGVTSVSLNWNNKHSCC